jgi:flagella basal body P-ring formation protein FlgA
MKQAAVALALPLACALAHAQALTPLFDEQAIRAYESQQVAAQGGGLSRFDVQLGAPDTSRIALAPCRRTEPFVPSGARLWGRSSLGLRCVDGATWTLVVPVTVTAWGPALVAATPLSAGTMPAAYDLREQEIELTRELPGLLRETSQLQGRTLTRNLQPGQALRAEMLRATPVLQAGDPVRLRIVGTGFAITASGYALASASDGQSLRVRTDFGRILTGIAREGRQVDVAQ